MDCGVERNPPSSGLICGQQLRRRRRNIRGRLPSTVSSSAYRRRRHGGKVEHSLILWSTCSLVNPLQYVLLSICISPIRSYVLLQWLRHEAGERYCYAVSKFPWGFPCSRSKSSKLCRLESFFIIQFASTRDFGWLFTFPLFEAMFCVLSLVCCYR